ncbi:MAG TPA: hypothetical protein VFQ54_01910, partial [Thermomicrobiales bacterium]|nr:hypothetical protein [Thermomicrobiales bacterium]
SGQALDVESPTSGFTFQLPTLTANLAVTLNTSDNGDIPAGSTWSLADPSGAAIDGGTLADAIPSGGTLPISVNPLIDGTYALTIDAGSGYEPYTGSIPVTSDPTDFTAQIVTAGQTSTESTVQYTIQTDDGTDIPAGSTWQLTQADSNYTPVASGAVPPHSTSPFTVSIPNVPYGTYVLFFVSPDYIYYDAQTVAVDQPIFAYTTTLVHQQGDLAATIATSDGASVPDGTTWSLTDADGTVVQSGTVGDVDALPITNPIDYGVYVLQVTAPGYLGFAAEIAIAQPSSSISIVLQKPAPTTGTVNLTVQTADGGAIPTNTIITIGGVSYVVPAGADQASVSAADVASSAVIPFDDVPAGTQPVSVTNADPYLDYSGTTDVVAGSAIDTTIVLQLAAVPSVTPEPTATTVPGASPTPTTVPGTTPTIAPGSTPTSTTTPLETPTTAPTTVATGTVPASTVTPTVGAATPIATVTVVPSKPGGGNVAVTTLPNTGQGAGTSDSRWELFALLAAMVLIVGIGFTTTRLRSSRR